MGTKSNRCAIGARATIHYAGRQASRWVKSGSSYLSQSELPVTFGTALYDRVERLVVAWPSGRVDDFRNVRSGRAYVVTEWTGDGGGVLEMGVTLP